MGDLDDFLVLKPKGSLSGGQQEGSSVQPGLDSPIRPSTVGLKLIDAPSGLFNGLVYRINGCSLERIVVTEGSDEDETNTTAHVVCSCPLSSDAVCTKASPDGRMVAVACIDGSLNCYDSTASGMTLRWSIPEAHTHVSSALDGPVSGDRSNAACASGPILALDFSPKDYALVLVDANNGMAIYDARVAEPTNKIPQRQQELVQNVSSASWQASSSNNNSDGGTVLPLVIGRYDGSIAVLKYTPGASPLQAVSECGRPSEENGFVCTHLNWTMDTLVVGLCLVIPPDEEEDPDEEDEDDNADHEACLYVTTIDELSLVRSTDWSEQGDVVPFFSVPKFGRHVFYTSVLRSGTKSRLIAVATNVGTDIGTLSIDDDGSTWQPVEFQEGAAASTPTNEDDEFVYPLGICIVQLASPSSAASFRLILASTDGSLSTFEFRHTNNPQYFAEQALGSVSDLPSDPLEIQIARPTPTSEGNSWVVDDEDNNNVDEDNNNSSSSSSSSNNNNNNNNNNVESSSSETEAKTEPSFGSASTTPSKPALSFGTTTSSAFGSGTSTGLTFGNPSTNASPFGAFGKTTGEPKSVFGCASAFGATAISATTAFGAPSPLGGLTATSAAPAFGAPSPLGGLTAAPKETASPLPVAAKPAVGFGSGTTFGSNTAVGTSGGFGALSSASSSNTGFGFGSSSSGGASAFGSGPSPFSSFSSKPSGGGFPAKPLFGSSSTPTKTTTTSSSPAEETTPDAKTESKVDVEDALLSDAEKSAAKVFDKIDSDRSGMVGVSMFEELSEALGEGFHGDEYDAQLNTVDPSKSGYIARSDFIKWYKNLVEGTGDGDNHSLDTEERAEREEEKENMASAFGELSEKDVSTGKSFILPDQFSKLIEGLGSVYCEEEHRKTIKKLTKEDGRMYEADVIDWYIEWLFGDGDDSDDDEDSEDGGNSSTKQDAGANTKSLGDIFKVDETEWKCEVCSIRNKDTLTQCKACETPRPGFEGKSSSGGISSAPGAGSSSSIGASGFTFGGNTSSSIGAGGFSFGRAKTSSESTSSSAGGFTFAAPTKSSSESTPSSSIGDGGFTFAAPVAKAPEEPTSDKPPSAALTDAEKTALRVFKKFDSVDSGSVDVSCFEDMLESLGEGFHGDEYDAQVALVDPSETGKISLDGFTSWYKSLVEGDSDDDNSLDTTDREEREEEGQSAKEAFGTLCEKDESGKAYILADRFSKVIEALGSVYCDEEHRKTLKKLKKDDDRIYESDFLVWYVDWLFGDGDDSNDDESDDDEAAKATVGGNQNDGKSLGDIFKVDETEWKCDVCSIRNKDTLTQCKACETPRPGFEGKTSGGNNASNALPASTSSIGVGGFTFGGATGTKASTGASSSIGAVGFTFAAPTVTTTKSPEASEQNVRALTDSEKTAARVFDGADSANARSVDVSRFEELLEALGEGFHGDEYDAQLALVDPSKSGKITKTAFLAWYKSLVEGGSDDDSLDTADREDREEEKQNAATAFTDLSKQEDGKSCIVPDQFSQLIEALGSVYCEEEHVKTIKKLKKDDGRIYETDFLEWYIEWLFGDGDDSDDESDDGGDDATADNTDKNGGKTTSLGDIFKVDETEWKCDVCSIRNKDTLNQCKACETPRLGFEGKGSSGSDASFKATAGSSSSIGAGGFSFGGTAAAASSSIGAGGFSFGGAPAKGDTATKSSIGASGFSFGRATAAPASSPFGVFGSKNAGKSLASSPSGAFSTKSTGESSSSPFPSFGAKSNTADTTKTSSSAAFPPMSSKTPTTCGASPATSATAKSSSLAGFPRTSTKARTDSFGAKPAFVANPRTKLQIQLDSVISSFSSTLAEVSRMRLEASSEDKEIRHGIEEVSMDIEQERSKLLNLDNALSEKRCETAFLLSRKTDSSRQIESANEMVQGIKKSNADTIEKIAGSQALDQESETNRRRFAASSRNLVRQMVLVGERVALLQATSDDPEDGQRHLLQGVLDLYKRTKQFEETSSRIERNIDLASKKVSFPSRTKGAGGRSTYSWDNRPFKSPKRNNKLRPIDIENRREPTMIQKSKTSKSSVSHWKNIEAPLREIGNGNTKIDRFDTLSIKGTKDQLPRDQRQVGQPKTVARSLLMSPTARASTNEQALVVSKRVSIFSPPSKTKARSGWDQPSSVDKSRTKQLSLEEPRELKQTTLSNASRETLADFGTAPEKLKAAIDIKKNESIAQPTSIGKIQPKDGQTKRRVDAAAALPPLPTKATSNPFSKKVTPATVTQSAPKKSTASSAPLPSMPKQASKNPFSKTPSSEAASKLAQSKSSTFVSAGNDASKEKESASTPFGNMKGLGNSLFSTGASQTGTKQTPSFAALSSASATQPAPSSGFGTTVSTMGASPFSSASITGQQKTTVSPFGSSATSSTPFGTTASNNTSGAPGSSMFQTQPPSPSPFGAPNSQTAATPFGSPPAPAPGPFGGATSGSSSSTPFGTAGGLSSASPFGNAAAPTSFGAPAPSPMQSNSQRLFNGKTARDLLYQFYQEKNPSKLGEVDKVLAKYSGNEEQMFRNLAKKYQLDPSVFGISAAAPTTGFGSPAPTAGFGQPSAMGGGASPFGQSAGGFGQPSPIGGGGMGSNPPGAGATFGSAATGSGFGSSGFGSLAQTSSPSPFGAPSGGFGAAAAPAGGFGAAAPTFGSVTPFGAPRR